MEHSCLSFFFNDTATTEIYTLSLHDALPILAFSRRLHARIRKTRYMHKMRCLLINRRSLLLALISKHLDRKSGSAGMPRPISYAVFCLKKKKVLPMVSLTGEQMRGIFMVTVLL